LLDTGAMIGLTVCAGLSILTFTAILKYVLYYFCY
jgi:hypothetical protein